MFEKPWDNPEEERKKKLTKLAKNACYAVGGGLTLWAMKFLYPQHEGSEKIANVLGEIAFVLVVYGLAMLAVIALKRNIALKANIVMTWIVIPSWVIYIFMQAAQS